MRGTERGDERRRLLAAVGGEDPEDEDETDLEQLSEESVEPAPDGGAVASEAPLVHCQECDRAYREPPVTCDRCGATTFAPRSAR